MQAPAMAIADILTKKPGPRGPSRIPRGPTADLLSSVPLFSGLSRRPLRRLAAATEPVSFGPREVILREGDLGEAFFAVLSGRAIFRGGAGG